MSDQRFLGPPPFGAGPGAAVPAGQYLNAVQSIAQAINAENAALNALLSAVVGNLLTGVQLAPVAPPAPPASGSILYVSNVDNHTYIVNAAGTRTEIAP